MLGTIKFSQVRLIPLSEIEDCVKNDMKTSQNKM